MTEPPAGGRTIRTKALVRVEGEGEMYVRVSGDEVMDVQLRIFEPPRLFEALLRGRDCLEAPDITARICGICPVAYQMSACAAIEDALGVEVDERVRRLRRILYCGEWIESHVLHLYLLHCPDFLGYESAWTMARDHPELVERGLRVKKLGNELIRVVGGREVHPINVRVGGFYKAPEKRDLEALAGRLETARDEALETVRFVAGLEFPDFDREVEQVALGAPAGEYPIDRGRLISTGGIDIAAAEFDSVFEEVQVPHSNALHARIRGRGSYLAGPMARFNLNRESLSPTAREAAREAGLEGGCRNPFASIVVRAIEILYAAEEALRLIGSYEPPDPPAAGVEPRAGVGHGATEAPRGVLYHRYELADDGSIASARIVPPTSQNQAAIEADLRDFVAANLGLDDDELRLRCEQAIRNYDPCISCATHFLRLEIDRA